MNNKIDINKIIQDAYKTLPKFPDGRINYSESNIRPILDCFLEYEGEILLLKRSKAVGTDSEKWSIVTGYLDDLVEIEEKAYIEVEKETGIPRKLINGIYKGEIHEFTDEKTWIIYPILFSLSERPNIILNWEHTEYKWVNIDKMKEYDLVADLYNTLMRIKR